MSTALEPRIYVASLSDYNAGRLHGVWIDGAEPIETIWSQVNAMLAASREDVAEEWAIHDYEGFGGVHLGEYEDLEQVARVARGIVEHGEAFAHWADYVGSSDWTTGLDRFEDAYQGHWPSTTAWADEVIDSFGVDLDGVVPSFLAPYVTIDSRGLAAGLASEFIVIETSAGIYVFEP